MNAIKSLLIFSILATLILSAVGCSESTDDTVGDETVNGDHGVTLKESQEIALQYLLGSPTYLFDGIDGTVKLVDTLTARCPSCWVFVYEFESSHAGYGDRTDQMLAQVISSHTANIAVNQGVINQAVMDGEWDMIQQKLTESDNDGQIVGGTPGSAGYSWDAERDGWHRPWDASSFVPADEKPEWDSFIPETTDGATVDTDPSSLFDREWILVSFGNDNPQSVLPDTRITITFSENDSISFKGSAGCNSYFGSFEIVDGKLVSGPIGATEMYCMDEGVMEQESQFLSTLGSVNGYQVDGDTLKLTGDDEVLVFTAETTDGITIDADPSNLFDREWMLVSFGEDDPQFVLQDTRITITFTENDSISFKGSAGCNSYFGSFEIVDGQLVSSPIGATRMYCADEVVMEQESQFLSALESVNGYQVDGDTLKLTGDDKVLVLTIE